VISAVPDVRNLDSKREVVAPGDTSEEGLRKKLSYVLETVEGRLKNIGASWSDISGMQLYCKYDLHPLFKE